MSSRRKRDSAETTDNQQAARVSRILILAALLTYLIICLISVYFHDGKTIWAILGGGALLVAPYLLLRNGRNRLGNLFLMIIVTATVTIIATVGQGIRDVAVIVYPVIFIYVGLTSDRPMLGLCGALTFAALLWLAFGQALGLFTPVPLFQDRFNLFYFSVLSVLLLVTAIAVDLLSASMRKNIAVARHEIEERRRVEQSLKDSNDLFSKFIMRSPFYAYIKEVTAEKSRVIQASENFQNMIGIPAQRMIGKTMEELFPADLAAKITADDWAVASEGRTIEINEELNGRTYATIKFPIPRRGENLLAGYSMDITERSRTENALRASEERFRRMFEGHAAAMLVIDPNSGRILDANQAAADFYGWPIHELRQMDIGHINLLPPVTLKGELEKAKSSERTTFEFRHRRADASIRDVEVFSSKIVVEGKDVLYSVIHDITERKRAEELLRQGEERYRLMFESAPIAINITRGAEIIYANPSYLALFGFSSLDELKSCPQLEVFAPESRPLIKENIQRRAQGLSVPDSYETVCLRRDGSRFPILMYLARMVFADGPAMVAFILDATERKEAGEEKARLQDQLIQAQKMESVGRLAGGVAHDFNNMLGVILGHAEIALEQVEPEHPLYDNLEEIRTAAIRSADLTRRLLAFARRQTIAPRVLDLNEIVRGMLKMLKRLIGEDIRLDMSPSAETWPLRMDPSQIDQILANLCVNARDAIAGVGTICIKTENTGLDEAFCARHPGFVPGDYVLLEVSDDGCGMSKQTISHLFEPFFTTKPVGEGTGLGLATVYGTVKQNGGFIDVQSESGRGSTFRIYLPRYRGMMENAHPEGSAAPLVKGQETILLVEDEPAILKLAARVLGQRGYTVLAAQTPGGALRMAKGNSGKIHLLMTDVVMPEMNGRQLARELLAVFPDLRCLFMSGYTADVISHQGLLDGGLSFIHKPFSMADLCRKVRETLDDTMPHDLPASDREKQASGESDLPMRDPTD
jgi:two-component system, cell cycle sensor histidine kinase and response regulator CckA